MKKRYLLIPAAVLLAAVLAVAIWPAPDAPDPAAQSPEERTEFMASRSFARLPDDAKRDYLTAARAEQGGGRPDLASLNEKQRQQLRENMRPVRQQQMQKRMDAYFDLPATQRAAYLDAMISERLQREQARSQGEGGGPRDGRPEGDGPGAGRRGGPTPERMKQRLENTPPEERAQRTEFRKALRERMEELGIEGGFGPPGRP